MSLFADSTYRNALSTAVLKLQETGKLTKLKNRWWKEERGGGACEVSTCRPILKLIINVFFSVEYLAVINAT